LSIGAIPFSKAELPGDLGKVRLVRAVTPAVHQHDRERIDSAIAEALQCLARGCFVERHQRLAIGADALVDFDDPIIKHRGKDDVASEDLRPGLVADPECVAEAAGDRQRNPLALSFEQGVGCDGRPHPDLRHTAAFPGQHAGDRLECCVLVSAGIFGQQLLDTELAVRRPRDHVGEGSATVDREGPAAVHELCL
jgi:hypothetical protein